MKKVLAAAGIGAAAIATTVGVAAPANAYTGAENAYLNEFRATGGYVYDADRLIRTGYRICDRLNYVDGNAVAREIFADTSWSDVPTHHEAARWVRTAANTLCPWTWTQVPPVRGIY